MPSEVSSASRPGHDRLAAPRLCQWGGQFGCAFEHQPFRSINHPVDQGSLEELAAGAYQHPAKAARSQHPVMQHPEGISSIDRRHLLTRT